MRTDSADSGIYRISERNCSARTPPPRFGKRFNRTPHSPLQNLRSRQLCGQNSIRTRRFKRNNLLRNRNVLWLYPCQKNSPHPLCRHNRRPNRRNYECYNGQIVVSYVIVKCSHFGTLFLIFGFLFPFRHDFILTFFNLSFPLPNRVIIPKNPILNHKIKKPFEKRFLKGLDKLEFILQSFFL